MRLIQLKIMSDSAQFVQDGWQVHRQRDFRGCETQALLPEAVGRNQLLRMENVLLYTTGYLSAFFQLDSSAIINALPGVCLDHTINGIYNTYYASGNGQVIKNTLNTASPGSTDVSTGAASSVAGSYISGVVKPVTFLAKKYCINPNPDNSHNGILNLTDMVLIHVPGYTATSISVYDNRIWMTTLEGPILISDNGDATSWNALNILWLPNQEGALAFVPVQGGAIVWGVNSLYGLTGASYLDIAFNPLMLGKSFTSGHVETGGITYILSTEGIYEAALNGADLIPHNQQEYFQSIFSILSNDPPYIQAVHLKKFYAIMFTWNSGYGGTQSFLYYYLSKGYSKVNVLLPVATPFAIALNDTNTDFLIGSTVPGLMYRSGYPSNDLLNPSVAILQTRHEDGDSTRNKIWKEFGVQVLFAVFGVTIEAYVDYSDISIVIASGANLSPGYNIFNLNNASGLLSGVNFPQGRTVSIKMTFDNLSVITMFLTNEDNGNFLVSETTGNNLIFDTVPGAFVIQELKLKYCQTGPDV